MNKVDFATNRQKLRLFRRPEPPRDHHIGIDSNGVPNRTAWIVTTDLDSANHTAELASAFGIDDLQIWFACHGLPTAGALLLVCLDQQMLDARGRRDYLAWLWKQTLPMPTVIVSRDFLLDVPTVIHPRRLMLAARLDENLFRALRNGHLNPPLETSEGRKAA